MKVTFDKQTLLSALTPAAGISQTKNTLVSVDGLLFECPPDPRFGDYDTDRDNLCRISAFDLEKGLRATVECNIYEKGIFVINTVKILQIVRALPDGDVTITIDSDNRVSIDGGASHFEITAQPGEDFPAMPMFVGERIYEMPQYRLRNLITATASAVAQNDQRAAFNGALFRVEGGVLTSVGCDGNRLAASKFDLRDYNDTVADAEMIVPGKFLIELTKLLRDSEDSVTMIVGRKHIIVKIDNIYFFTRMIDTEYLKYERLLPTSYMTEAYVSRTELLSAIERASIVTEDKLGGSGRVHVKLEFAGREIHVSSISSGGSVFETVPVAMDGADVAIGFNCRYLLETLRSCPSESERLRIRLNTPIMGIVIEPVGGSGFVDAHPDRTVYGERELDAVASPVEDDRMNKFMYLVMPIRMNN